MKTIISIGLALALNVTMFCFDDVSFFNTHVMLWCVICFMNGAGCTLFVNLASDIYQEK